MLTLLVSIWTIFCISYFQLYTSLTTAFLNLYAFRTYKPAIMYLSSCEISTPTLLSFFNIWQLLSKNVLPSCSPFWLCNTPYTSINWVRNGRVLYLKSYLIFGSAMSPVIVLLLSTEQWLIFLWQGKTPYPSVCKNQLHKQSMILSPVIISPANAVASEI